MNWVVPENIHTFPTPWLLWKFQLNFMNFFKFFGFTESPTPRKFQSLLWGNMDIFLNCTLWRMGIFFLSIYLPVSWDYIFLCCCSLGITSSCTDEQRLLKSNKKEKNSRDILLVYTETWRLSCKTGIYRFLSWLSLLAGSS